jgi:UDP-N-acetylglucosamine 2-epimerase (non-hydrolysing)
MNLAIVYGTRPEFLKLKILIQSIQCKVIKIAQHTHILDDAGYYTDILQIDELCADRIANIGANILQKLPALIADCTHVLAQGDTASVFYSLLCAFQLRKRCIHLEAGMRTYNLAHPFPEEGYRQMISRITDIHLCPSAKERELLLQERVGGAIHVVGNTILDLVKSYGFETRYESAVLITLHRRENWDTFKDYILALAALATANAATFFYFLTHPNPSFQVILENLADNIPANMHIIDSMPHRELIHLLSRCACVITDSGGIQEEANFLGKHIYVLRKVTERTAIPAEHITLCNVDDIPMIRCDRPNHTTGMEYGDGSSCVYIAKILEEAV